MRARKIVVGLVILITCFMSSCSLAEGNQNNICTAILEETDPRTSESGKNLPPVSEYGSFRPQNSMGMTFLETEQAAYCLAEDKILFFTQENLTLSFLCGKPECTHNTADCNADAGWELAYFDGKLYTVNGGNGGEIRIISMDLDGTNHQVAATAEMPTYPNGSSGGTVIYKFLNEYLYCFIMPGENNYEAIAMRIDLRTKKTERLWEEQLSSDMFLTPMIQFSNGCLYCEVIRGDSKEYDTSIYCGDPEKNTFVQVMPNNGHAVLWQIRGDDILHFDKDTGFCKFHMTTGEDECLQPVPGDTERWGRYGWKYEYVVTTAEKGPYTTTIYDEKYEPVWSFEHNAELTFLSETENYIIFGEYRDGYYPSIYLCIDELETGQPEIHKFNTPFLTRYSFR
ncbi:MAG: hypothetical protein IKO68_11325 [Oscillospiraceae bacterium]|nr:hypothetical protein [Oscillospiraceae bacterium]